MATIDLIVLGMVKQQPRSAYEIQKLVEYRNISKWVKISTPSIYKKVIQLEEKGYLAGTAEKGKKTAEKTVYTLTEQGEEAFETLMVQIAAQPVRFFLDFNAVIVNLDGLPEEGRKACLDSIAKNVAELKETIQENLQAKEYLPEIPETGLAVLRQQLTLAQAIETWLESLRRP